MIVAFLLISAGAALVASAIFWLVLIFERAGLACAFPVDAPLSSWVSLSGIGCCAHANTGIKASPIDTEILFRSMSFLQSMLRELAR
jgi:hypothetical protein